MSQIEDRSVESNRTQSDMLKILTRLAGRGEDARIDPVISPRARIGYEYPEVFGILDCTDNEALGLLESLSEAGCLDRELVDKVDLCPYCLDVHLRLRRLCPYCRSGLIIRKEVIHHYRCGWLGLEEEARRGTNLVCPKCEKTLRHIGVDYERSPESYYCTVCDKIFVEPLEEFLSISCGRQIPKGGVMIHPVFAYRITPAGLKAADQQSFEGINPHRGIVEDDLNLYTRSYLERKFDEMVNRFLRYRAGFAAAMIHIDQMESWKTTRGHGTASSLRKLLSALLRGETRGADLPGFFEEDRFILLLPQTDYRGARRFATRFMDRVRNLQDPLLEEQASVSIALGVCPEDGETTESIVSALATRTEECVKAGGGIIMGLDGRVETASPRDTQEKTVEAGC
jgi:diguanylate cyclase (GGDEF)-like protein